MEFRTIVATVETQTMAVVWSKGLFHSLFGPVEGERLWRQQPAKLIWVLWLLQPKAEA